MPAFWNEDAFSVKVLSQRSASLRLTKPGSTMDVNVLETSARQLCSQMHLDSAV